MKFLSRLRKPAWESRDAAERARAVTESPAAEIESRLPDFARTDPDASVRRAAVRRLGDLALLADRMRHDADAGVQEAARVRLRSLLVDAKQPQAARERLVRVEEDQDLLAHVAVEAAEPELRRLALERCGRSGLLLERCLRDPDAATRLWLLERIDARGALERIAEQSRKSDKVLARAARERVTALKLAAGDPETLRERALALCEELDRLRREHGGQDLAREQELAAEWAGLRQRVAPEMERRVAGYFDALRAARAPRAAPEMPAPEVVAEPAAPVAAAMPPAAPVDEAALAQQAAAREQHAREQAQRQEAARVAQRAQRDAVEHVEQALRTLDMELEGGHLQGARAALAAVDTAITALPHADGGTARRRNEASQRVDKLAQWQRWSNNRQRARLCEEAEKLSGAGLHPDAVATRIAELKAEWARLDAAEPPREDAPEKESGLARRFRAVCHRALAPARGYFEKRRELREAKRGDIDSLVVEMEAELAGAWRPERGPTLRSRTVEALRRLDEVDPRARADLGKRLRAILTRLDEARSQAEQGVAERKRKLIANLRRELARAEVEDAVARARDAQAEFKRLGRASREADDALWKELREIVDPWFAKVADAEATRQREQSDLDHAAKAILADLESLAQADRDVLRHVEPRLQALSTRWRELPRPQRAPEHDARQSNRDRPGHDGGRGDLRRRDGRDGGRGDERRHGEARGGARGGPDERAFDRAVARVQEAAAAALASRAADELRAVRAAADCCAEAEQADDDVARSDAATRFETLVLPAEAQVPMRARLQRALSAAPADAAQRAAAGERLADLTVQIEFVAGVDTPVEEMSRRRAHQVARLAAHLAGELRRPAPEQARELLLAACATGPQAAPVHAGCMARIDRALRALAL